MSSNYCQNLKFWNFLARSAASVLQRCSKLKHISLLAKYAIGCYDFWSSFASPLGRPRIIRLRQVPVIAGVLLLRCGPTSKNVMNGRQSQYGRNAKHIWMTTSLHDPGILPWNLDSSAFSPNTVNISVPLDLGKRALVNGACLDR